MAVGGRRLSGDMGRPRGPVRDALYARWRILPPNVCRGPPGMTVFRVPGRARARLGVRRPDRPLGGPPPWPRFAPASGTDQRKKRSADHVRRWSIGPVPRPPRMRCSRWTTTRSAERTSDRAYPIPRARGGSARPVFASIGYEGRRPVASGAVGARGASVRRDPNRCRKHRLGTGVPAAVRGRPDALISSESDISQMENDILRLVGVSRPGCLGVAPKVLAIMRIPHAPIYPYKDCNTYCACLDGALDSLQSPRHRGG